MKSTHPIFRAIALSLVIALLAEPAAWAMQESMSATGPSLSASPNTANLSFVIPASMGIVEDKFSSDPSLPHTKTLYLIQDAHTNESCQKSIASILDVLLREKKVKYVFLEAGVGDNSLSFIRSEAPLAARKKVAKSWMNQGELKGCEYLDVTSDHDMKLWGVEDAALYQESVTLYRDIVAGREEFEAYLQQVDHAVSALRPRIYNPLFLAFDDKRLAYVSGRTSFHEYVDMLFKHARMYGVDLGGLSSLESLKSLSEKERALDFSKVSREQNDLFSSLPREEADELSESMRRFQPVLSSLKSTDEKGSQAFYALLAEKIQGKPYPELSKYLEYVRSAGGIDAKRLFAEEALLEERLYSALALSDEETDLLAVSRMMKELHDLFELKMKPETFSKYRERGSRRTIEWITGFLNRKITLLRQAYEDFTFLKEGFGEYVAKAERFYELTRERDERFVKSAVEKMQESGLTSAVLITGGYHTPNLKELLRSKGVSYVSITPQILKETNHARYEKILFERTLASSLQDSSAKNPSEVSDKNAEPPLAMSPRPLNRFLDEIQSGAEQSLTLAAARMAKRTDGDRLNQGSVGQNFLAWLKSLFTKKQKTEEEIFREAVVSQAVREILESLKAQQQTVNNNKKDFLTHFVEKGYTLAQTHLTQVSPDEEGVVLATSIKAELPSLLVAFYEFSMTSHWEDKLQMVLGGFNYFKTFKKDGKYGSLFSRAVRGHNIANNLKTPQSSEDVKKIITSLAPVILSGEWEESIKKYLANLHLTLKILDLYQANKWGPGQDPGFDAIFNQAEAEINIQRLRVEQPATDGANPRTMTAEDIRKLISEVEIRVSQEGVLHVVTRQEKDEEARRKKEQEKEETLRKQIVKLIANTKTAEKIDEELLNLVRTEPLGEKKATSLVSAFRVLKIFLSATFAGEVFTAKKGLDPTMDLGRSSQGLWIASSKIIKYLTNQANQGQYGDMVRALLVEHAISFLNHNDPAYQVEAISILELLASERKNLVDSILDEKDIQDGIIKRFEGENSPDRQIIWAQKLMLVLERLTDKLATGGGYEVADRFSQLSTLIAKKVKLFPEILNYFLSISSVKFFIGLIDKNRHSFESDNLRSALISLALEKTDRTDVHDLGAIATLQTLINQDIAIRKRESGERRVPAGKPGQHGKEGHSSKTSSVSPSPTKLKPVVAKKTIEESIYEQFFGSIDQIEQSLGSHQSELEKHPELKELVSDFTTGVRTLKEKRDAVAQSQTPPASSAARLADTLGDMATSILTKRYRDYDEELARIFLQTLREQKGNLNLDNYISDDDLSDILNDEEGIEPNAVLNLADFICDFFEMDAPTFSSLTESPITHFSDPERALIEEFVPKYFEALQDFSKNSSEMDKKMPVFLDLVERFLETEELPDIELLNRKYPSFLESLDKKKKEKKHFRGRITYINEVLNREFFMPNSLYVSNHVSGVFWGKVTENRVVSVGLPDNSWIQFPTVIVDVQSTDKNVILASFSEGRIVISEAGIKTRTNRMITLESLRDLVKQAGDFSLETVQNWLIELGFKKDPNQAMGTYAYLTLTAGDNPPDPRKYREYAVHQLAVHEAAHALSEYNRRGLTDVFLGLNGQGIDEPPLPLGLLRSKIEGLDSKEEIEEWSEIAEEVLAFLTEIIQDPSNFAPLLVGISSPEKKYSSHNKASQFILEELSKMMELKEPNINDVLNYIFENVDRSVQLAEELRKREFNFPDEFIFDISMHGEASLLLTPKIVADPEPADSENVGASLEELIGDIVGRSITSHELTTLFKWKREDSLTPDSVGILFHKADISQHSMNEIFRLVNASDDNSAARMAGKRTDGEDTYGLNLKGEKFKTPSKFPKARPYHRKEKHARASRNRFRHPRHRPDLNKVARRDINSGARLVKTPVPLFDAVEREALEGLVLHLLREKSLEAGNIPFFAIHDDTGLPVVLGIETDEASSTASLVAVTRETGLKAIVLTIQNLPQRLVEHSTGTDVPSPAQEIVGGIAAESLQTRLGLPIEELTIPIAYVGSLADLETAVKGDPIELRVQVQFFVNAMIRMHGRSELKRGSFYIDTTGASDQALAALREVLSELDDVAQFIQLETPSNEFQGLVIRPFIGEAHKPIADDRTLMPRVVFEKDKIILWENLFWSQTRVVMDIQLSLVDGKLPAQVGEELNLSPELRSYLLSRLVGESGQPFSNVQDLSNADIVEALFGRGERAIQFLFQLEDFDLFARLQAASLQSRQILSAA